MNQKLFESFADQNKLFFAPVKQFNQAFVEQLEKLSEFQIESMRRYSDLGIERLKSAMAVEDAESIQQFAQHEVEYVTQLNAKLLEDAKKITEIGNDFRSNVESMIKDGMSNFEEAKATAKPKTKSAA